ncbi:MAG TPA: VOC family protein [Steroidobacteraceae bacterium]
MAIADNAPLAVSRLARFGLTARSVGGLSDFYGRAFGCRPLNRERRSGAKFEKLMDVRGGAECATLVLGNEVIEILEFDHPGRPYPDALSPYSPLFQHFAIVVADMDRAVERLAAIGGWTAISRGGPQRLPQRSGGVTAFKFRDPDGHPLEFLAFAKDDVPQRWQAQSSDAVFLGIDHSAISIADTGRSTAFYESLGLKVLSRTINVGDEQQRLDGVPDPHVEVTALKLGEDTPHIELLCYRGPSMYSDAALRSNDLAATRLVFERSRAPASQAIGADAAQLLLDPDGHRLQVAGC